MLNPKNLLARIIVGVAISLILALANSAFAKPSGSDTVNFAGFRINGGTSPSWSSSQTEPYNGSNTPIGCRTAAGSQRLFDYMDSCRAAFEQWSRDFSQNYPGQQITSCGLEYGVSVPLEAGFMNPPRNGVLHRCNTNQTKPDGVTPVSYELRFQDIQMRCTGCNTTYSILSATSANVDSLCPCCSDYAGKWLGSCGDCDVSATSCGTCTAATACVNYCNTRVTPSFINKKTGIASFQRRIIGANGKPDGNPDFSLGLSCNGPDKHSPPSTIPHVLDKITVTAKRVGGKKVKNNVTSDEVDFPTTNPASQAACVQISDVVACANQTSQPRDANGNPLQPIASTEERPPITTGHPSTVVYYQTTTNTNTINNTTIINQGSPVSAGGSSSGGSSSGSGSSSGGSSGGSSGSGSGSSSGGSSGSISGGGDCEAPPACDGDPIQCYHAQELWKQHCELEELRKAPTADEVIAVAESFQDPTPEDGTILPTVKHNLTQLLIPYTPSGCISNITFSILGKSYNIDLNKYCGLFHILGALVHLSAAWLSVRILTGIRK